MRLCYATRLWPSTGRQGFGLCYATKAVAFVMQQGFGLCYATRLWPSTGRQGFGLRFDYSSGSGDRTGSCFCHVLAASLL